MTPPNEARPFIRRIRPGLWLGRVFDGVAAVVLFALMAMTCLDVAGRELINTPLDGATELTRLMMAGIVFAVLPMVTWREGHVSVDIMERWFPSHRVNMRQIVINVVGAVAMGAIAERVWALSARTAEYGDATEYLHIPLYPIMYFMSVMSGAAAVALALNAVRYARGRGPLSPSRIDQA